jgi:hypothetical protein
MADSRDFKNYDLEKEILINKNELIKLGFIDDDPYLHLKVNKDISLQFHCYEHDDDFITMCVSNDDFDDALHYELKHIKTISQVKSLYYILTNKKLKVMNPKKEANKIMFYFLEQLKTATPTLNRPNFQAKQCSLIHIELMIQKMNTYSDLESSLYKNGDGNTTIVAEIICLESIKKELELL